MNHTIGVSILLIEENSVVGQYVATRLGPARCEILWADNPADALALLRTERYVAALVIDMSSFEFDGRSFLIDLRSDGIATPVIGLSADSSARNRVDGLNAGADDFLQIPFHVSELLARIHALARRVQSNESGVLRFADIELNIQRRTAYAEGELLAVSPKEFIVLECLLAEGGLVVPREQLESAIYNLPDTVSSNAIEVHVHNLRKKLGSVRIETVRGIGYRLAIPTRH